MRIGEDGRLYGVNPEAGFFGVAPGTSFKSNPNCMKALTKNAVFTNTALTPDGDVWWEGMTKKCPKLLSSWLRKEHYPDSKFKAAHPNARFTAPVEQIPTLDPDWKKPEGVPKQKLGTWCLPRSHNELRDNCCDNRKKRCPAK